MANPNFSSEETANRYLEEANKLGSSSFRISEVPDNVQQNLEVKPTEAKSTQWIVLRQRGGIVHVKAVGPFASSLKARKALDAYASQHPEWIPDTQDPSAQGKVIWMGGYSRVRGDQHKDYLTIACLEETFVNFE